MLSLPAMAILAKAVPSLFVVLRARVLICECNPICALQACMEGFQVVTMEEAVGDADIFVSSTGNFNIITLEHEEQCNCWQMAMASSSLLLAGSSIWVPLVHQPSSCSN